MASSEASVHVKNLRRRSQGQAEEVYNTSVKEVGWEERWKSKRERGTFGKEQKADAGYKWRLVWSLLPVTIQRPSQFSFNEPSGMIMLYRNSSYQTVWNKPCVIFLNSKSLQFWTCSSVVLHLFPLLRVLKKCRLTITCSNVRHRSSLRRATSWIITTTTITWTACWTVPSVERVVAAVTWWWTRRTTVAATVWAAWMTCSPTNKKIRSCPTVRWRPNWTCRRSTSPGSTASFLTTPVVALTGSSQPPFTWVSRRSVHFFFFP